MPAKFFRSCEPIARQTSTAWAREAGSCMRVAGRSSGGPSAAILSACSSAGCSVNRPSAAPGTTIRRRCWGRRASRRLPRLPTEGPFAARRVSTSISTLSGVPMEVTRLIAASVARASQLYRHQDRDTPFYAKIRRIAYSLSTLSAHRHRVEMAIEMQHAAGATRGLSCQALCPDQVLQSGPGAKVTSRLFLR
jgi:hypothetical protein